MKWEKKGHIYKPKGEKHWSKTHAQVPFALLISNDTLRVFFSTRDENSCSSVSFIDVDPEEPSRILYEHNEPVLSKGELGAYDDSGTMPSWFLFENDKIYLYYTGWNRSDSVSYRLSIGLAVSEDYGKTFKKMFKGPIMDRGINDPIWVGQPCVLKEGGVWKMWYLNCEKVENINNHPEPFYNIKYATSANGIDWVRRNEVCIDFDFGNIDAIGRPCVYKEGGKYKMLHSNRRALGYRVDKTAGYTIGYSESEDGINWIRLDDEVGISKSEEGWDSIMIEYCTTYRFKGVRYLIYNGNGFGASGFGYAIQIED